MKPKKPIAKLHRSELVMAVPEYYDIPMPSGMAIRQHKTKSKRTAKK